MEIVKRLEEIPSPFKLGIILGNFDGVHLGHQHILGQVKDYCNDVNAKFCVITFDPHPLILLNDYSNFLIMSLRQKRSALASIGVDFLVEMTFSKELSQQSPQSFLKNVLFPVENSKYFFLGYDFRFGADRAGDYQTVEAFVKGKDINLIQLEKYMSDKKITPSSSVIREQIKEGKVKGAGELLGKSYCLEGSVVKGDGRGRTIGFPTANLKYAEASIVPAAGVYKTNTLVRGRKYKSLTNIGFNPTFIEERKLRVETHLLSFNEDIYNEIIEIEFLDRVRDEMKFNGREELINQIQKDITGTYS